MRSTSTCWAGFIVRCCQLRCRVVAITITEVPFHRNEHEAVTDAMRRLTERGDGQGWINLQPALSDEEYNRVPDRSGLGAWFSGRGPAVAMATWTPPTLEGRMRPAQIGLEHGTGPKALERLADELRQARGETAEARRSLAAALAAQQPPPQLEGAGAGELEAQWVRRLVQVQAAEASTLQRRLQYLELDKSLVGSSAEAADLLAKREGLCELGRIIEKAKQPERMALGPLGGVN